MPETIIDLGKKVKSKYPGQYDDLSDDEVGRRVKAKYPDAYGDFVDIPAKPAEPAPAKVTTIGDILSRFGSPGDKPETAWDKVRRVYGIAMNTAPDAETMMGPEAALLAAAGTGGAATEGMNFRQALGNSPMASAAKSVRNLLPNAERAGEKFQTVMGAAKDVPVDTTAATSALEKAQELEAHGSSPLPRVMRKFAQYQKPVTGKFAGVKVQMQPQPMTYETGRQFGSASSALSTDETMKMAPAMKKQVADFAQALKTANRDAAAKVGMGDLYDQAMKEYRQAKNLEEAMKVAKKYAVHAILGTGVLYGIEREVERLFGKR